MNLAWLEDFLALAATGNFSKAAEERHSSQPAFSRRIRALEEWLGTDLFDRSSQPATLTAAGTWFRDTSRDMLARVNRVPAEARAVAAAQSTTLRFASTHALSFTFLPGWLQGFESRTKTGAIALVSDVLARCEALLLNGQVQFVMSHAHASCPSDLSSRGFPSVTVGQDRLIPVSAPDASGVPRHRLGQGTAGEPLPVLTYSAESGIGRILHGIHAGALQDYSTGSVFSAHLASVLRRVALDARGLAWLPKTLIADDLASGRLVVAAPERWHVDMEIRLYRDRSEMSKTAEEFWAAVSDQTG